MFQLFDIIRDHKCTSKRQNENISRSDFSQILLIYNSAERFHPCGDFALSSILCTLHVQYISQKQTISEARVYFHVVGATCLLALIQQESVAQYACDDRVAAQFFVRLIQFAI
ncbi:Hypothetical_protein [Hexamita inflata]|uniref:Hypothetical_protein n=1 Tax=Hexamita inflata TaxID=28002 RepID=A0AA86Q9V4_9EUKA|nr:Hypothetical protein HINF_LOCUS36623 [Hexamita inflata]CAI9948979.1 Hypothetical protein HINF_LOCUS36624 [Hexamita inflata]